MAHVEPHPKSGVFQFRRRIPTDLQVVLGRKTHYESLKTKDRRLANQRGAEADARFEAILKDARERLALAYGHEHAGAAPPEPEQAPPPLLSPTAANEALTRWKQAEIGKAVLAAFNGLLDMNGLGDEAHRRSERIHRLGQPNPWDHIPDFHARLVAALASQGMRVRPDHPALGWLLIPFRDAWLEVERAISKMVMGQLDPATLHVQDQSERANPGSSATPGSAALAGLRLTELAEQYIADQRPRPDTVSEVRAIIARLAQFMGEDKPAHAITKADLTSFKLLAAKLPTRMTAQQRAMSIHALAALEHQDTLTPRTVRKWFDLLGACFAWGVKHDLLPANPVTGIKPDFRKSETNDRDSYTPDELQALFTSRIYTGPAKATEFWLPLLGLFTGARLNELGQLAVRDVDVDGPVPSITIDDRSDNPEVVKRLKNTQSRRVVPIHPKLMELGFGEFVRAAQGTHVFPELPRQAKAGPECTAAFSKWFGRYLKEVGIKRPRLAAAHSLRHTFVEACDNCGVNPKVTSALVGHSGGHGGSEAGSAMTRRYGGGTKLPMLLTEISKVRFEGFPAALRKWSEMACSQTTNSV